MVMRRRSILAAGAAILLGAPGLAPSLAQGPAPAAPGAGTYKVDPRHASVTGKVSHLGLSDYTFRFRRFDATIRYDPARPRDARVEVVLEPASVDSGVAALDTELAGERFFHAAQFPQARFVSTAVDPGDGKRGTVTGQLTFRGVTKPATMAVVFNGAGVQGRDSKLGFSGTMAVKRSDWGMTALVGPVGDVVRLAIEAEFIRQP